MKRLWIGLILIAGIAYATCDPTLTPTVTTNIGLSKPQINSCSWGAVTNANWDILDSSVPTLSNNNTFTGTMTDTNLLTVGTMVSTYSYSASQTGNYVYPITVNNPNFIGVYRVGMKFAFNNNFGAGLMAQSGSVLCTDAVHPCYFQPLMVTDSLGNGLGIYLNKDSRIQQGVNANGYGNVFSSATFIGPPPSDVTIPPYAGLQVAGGVILNSTATVSGLVSLTSATATGYFQAASKTKAQINALTPAAVGQIYQCSDCTTVPVCISTGTANGAFSIITNKTTVCG